MLGRWTPSDPVTDRLLAGPALGSGPESYRDHLDRLGPRPAGDGASIAALESSGLLGRGGAGFPVGRKWRAMAERSDGRAVLVVNGAEGEPASFKDRTLMVERPHLIIDGAVLAAEAVGAEDLVLYIGEEHGPARSSMARALAERAEDLARRARLVPAPMGYVAGEATAAVHYIDSGDARPITTPPRVSERGVGGRPTLVQNVESLAYAALIARFGDGWYRSVGRHETRGTALITLSGAVAEQGVREIELGTTVGEVAEAAGAKEDRVQAVIMGGYFGAWASTVTAWDMPLDPGVMASQGLAFGCGIVGLLPLSVCGLVATERIMAFMADESAGQCGPCVFGLRAIADAVSRLAQGQARPEDLPNVARWTDQVVGRGACHHPDGAAQLMASALDVFRDEFSLHARTGRCSIDDPGERRH